MVLIELLHNLALLVALAAAAQVIESRWDLRRGVNQVLYGLLFGMGGVIGMMTPAYFLPGIIFDGRSIILSVAGLFGGPVVALVAALICAAYRLWLGGGGAAMGVSVIFEAAALGTAFYYWRRRTNRPLKWTHLWGFGLLVHAVMFALVVLLPGGARSQVWYQIGPAILGIYPVATMLVCLIFQDYERQRQDHAALVASEARHRVTLMSVGDGVISTDVQGRVTMMNLTAQTLTGWRQEEAIGKPFGEVFRIFNENTRAPVEDPVARVLREGVVVGLANHTVLVSRDGVERPIADSGAPIRDETGAVIGVVLVFRDQTAERAAREQLRRSEEHFRRLYEQSPVAYQSLDEQGRLLDANPAWLRLMGYQREEVIGRWFGDFLAPGQEALFRERFPAFKARGETHGVEFDLVRKDGACRTVIVDGVVARNAAGEFLHTHCVLHDITERKRAETALRESEALFRSLFENHTAVKLMIDPADGQIVDANKAAAAFYGWSREELRRMKITDINTLPPAQVKAEIERVRLQERVCFEFQHRRADGSVREVAVYCALIQSGGKERLHSIIQDITERKRAEAALRERELELQAILEATGDGILAVDNRGERIITANRRFAEMWGIPQALIETGDNQTLRRFVLPQLADPDSFLQRLQSLYPSREPSMDTLEFRDGRVLERCGFPIIKDGAALGRVWSFRDITKRKQAEQQLRQTYTLLSLFIRHSPIYAYIKEVTPVGCLVRAASENFVDLVGQPGSAIVGKTMEELFPPEFAAKITADDLAVVARNEVMRIEENFNGRNYITIKFPIVLDDKTLVAGYTIDITESKQTEAALERIARDWQATFDATNDAIWVLDADQRVVRSNKIAEQFFGRPCGEIVGQYCHAIVHGTSCPHPNCPFVRARHSGRRERIELEQGDRWFEVMVDPILDTAGQCVGAVHIVSDITEQKRAAEQLQEQAALLDAANDAIYVCRLDHTITYWNHGAERLYGWTRSDAVGRKITELGELDPAAFAAAEQCLLAQGQWSGELKKTDRAGREKIILCRWTMLRDAQGEPKEVLAINTDITERKQLEANYLRAQRMEGIGALAGGIAHDLNNILAPILMVGPMLRETLEDAEARQMVETVETCAQRGAHIIKQLLLFARGKPGARVALPAGHLLKELHKLVRETFPRNIQARVEVLAELWPLLGDATQIHQALMNLCVNARDAMPDGGTLTLAAANVTMGEATTTAAGDVKPGNYVCLRVTDTGVGIPPEHLDRIFDPFFTTKEIGKGTGLGLATVLGIVRGHDGFVRVNSQPGHGTTFELCFPAAASVEGPAAARSAPLPPRAQGELILLVDDEPAVRELLQVVLEKHGYQVVTAGEGGQALTVFNQHASQIKAVVTDMMMPGMDGPKLVRALRQFHPRLPILGMTGLAEQASVKGLDELNLPELLVKPFPGSTLLGALRQALAAPPV